MHREDTTRVLVTFPQGMVEAIKRQAKKHGVPMAAIIRYATEVWLREQGEDVRDDIVWGGARFSPKEDDLGQPVAALVH